MRVGNSSERTVTFGHLNGSFVYSTNASVIGGKSGNKSVETIDDCFISLIPSIVLCAVGVFGNSCALGVLCKTSREFRKTVFYTLVATLTVVDLLGQLATTPVVVVTYLNNLVWPAGQELCDYFSFVMIFSGLMAMQIICAMAVERYIALRHPFVCQRHLTHDKSKYIIIAITAVSLLLATLPIVGFGSNVRHFPGTWCFIRFTDTQSIQERIYDYIYCSFGFAYILVTIICNISVAYTMIKMNRRRKNRTPSLQSVNSVLNSRSPPKRIPDENSELQMLILLVGITSVFTICWAPLMVRIFISLIQPSQDNDDNMSVLIVIRLAALNQVLDPWVYILFRKELFDRLRQIFRCEKISQIDTPLASQTTKIGLIFMRAARRHTPNNSITRDAYFNVKRDYNSCARTPDELNDGVRNVSLSGAVRQNTVAQSDCDEVFP
ncbi:LOW QUALITY PROTEIN: prostaglandin E2 receptor EP4 subtype-like [Tubulanus polymorphus]|uniref:LOW QUALITY PROTEIN: prostaglandin E2 receptor EP4 subtype-like n=1 Tax=Tubulanus polymorphus TaxID=672921 RepID=UPI003DA5F03B